MPRRTPLLVALQGHPLRRKRGRPVLSQLTVGSLLRKEEQELDDGEEVDPAIEEKFYLGLDYVKENWKRQGKLIENLQKDVVSMRT